MLVILRATIFLNLIFIFGACSGGGSSEASTHGALQQPWNGETAYGEINGQEWLFQSGSAHIIRKNFQYYLVLRLWNSRTADPCLEKTGSALQVRLTTPKHVGEWSITPEDPFNSAFSLFFSDRDFKPQPLDNMKADIGNISVFSLDKAQLSGYFSGSFQHPKAGRTLVRGGFSVPICMNFVSDGDNF
jgi:hypothetical protein